MEYHSVLFDTEESVAIMTLNRPDKMNAYSNELGDEFLDVLERVKKDPQTRALIITGAGRAFCSGVDLDQCRQAIEDRVKGNKEWHDHLLQWITTTPKLMMEMEKPIIAAINGAAIGMGCSIALACDIRIVAESARLALSFSKVALVPEFGSTYTLPRIVGLAKALELALTNGVLTAAEAKKIGLVNEVIPSKDLMARARELASSLAKNSPLSIGLIKQGLYQGAMGKIEGQLKWEGWGLDTCFDSADHAEGVSAFLEKREPHF